MRTPFADPLKRSRLLTCSRIVAAPRNLVLGVSRGQSNFSLHLFVCHGEACSRTASGCHPSCHALGGTGRSANRPMEKQVFCRTQEERLAKGGIGRVIPKRTVMPVSRIAEHLETDTRGRPLPWCAAIPHGLGARIASRTGIPQTRDPPDPGPNLGESKSMKNLTDP